MRKISYFIVLLIFIQNTFAQQTSNWTGYFSYNQIKDISVSNDELIVATENAFFKKNITTNSFKSTTTIEGLSGQTISQIHYSKKFKKTILGHEDGLITIINDNGNILNVVDILNKPSIPSQFKKINHFTEFNDNLYISTDYGISLINLSNNEFGDTYFIGTNGTSVKVKQITINNNYIYAAVEDFGILKASVNNPNLIDYNQWTNISAGNWIAIESVNSEIVVINSTGEVFKLANDIPNLFFTLPQTPVDVRFNENYLNITTPNSIYLFSENLNYLNSIGGFSNVTNIYTCSIIKNNSLFVGTQFDGLLKTGIASQTSITNLSPNGPVSNKIFNVGATSDELWVVYGDYNATYNPYPLDSRPISKFNRNKTWQIFPYNDLFDAKSIVKVYPDPKNENTVYFSSFYSGLLKFENNLPSKIYNASNSSMISIAGQTPDDIRVGDAIFDNQNNLWVTNSLVRNNLHVLRNDGQWQAYNLSCFSVPEALSITRLVVDKNNTKWIATNFAGLIGFNEQQNKCMKIDENPGEGNLPISEVKAVAIDKDDKIWIGTSQGLRVIQNSSAFLNQNQIDANAIIILEEGLAQELLFQKSISDIVVDGANNKWIATLGAGVFYINADGQKTYAIYTKENSPLPSNMVVDIEINKITGEVFFVTDSGMVSIQGSATNGAENLENVVVFPNPVRPNFTGQVTITGLMDKCNVKITDINGNLVHEAKSQGGTILWDTTAFGKYKVSSGVYMVLITAESGEEVGTEKIMIVR